MGLTQLPAMIGLVNAAMLFMAANPIVLIIAGVALLVIALVLLEQKFHWIESVMAITGAAWGVLWSGMTSAVQGAADLIRSIIDTMVGVIKWGVNIGIDSINAMIRGINLVHFDRPIWLGGGRVGFSIEQIPRLAEGAIVTSPTIAMIGEEGPEAVVPLSRGGGAAGGAGIGGDIVFKDCTFTGNEEQIARNLYTLISRTNRGRGTS